MQEPWLDPVAFFSDGAYVVEALPSRTEAGSTDAAFVGGGDSLVSYLKGALLPHIVPGMGWLKPPVVEFTVGAKGEASNVELVATSGHAGLDARMVQVVTDMPRWTPAKAANGGAMEQAFVFRVVQGGCTSSSTNAPIQDTRTGQLPVTDTTLAKEHPYDLMFEVERSGDNTFTLITTVKLYGGSYYASPNCTRNFKGKFHIELEAQERIVLGDRVKEIPLKMDRGYYHPLVHGPQDWVSVDTRNEQVLTVNGQKDLEVKGMCRFTIEPRCTLEEIPFVIRQRGGRLTIERVGC